MPLTKFRLIYLPYLIIAGIVIPGYVYLQTHIGPLSLPEISMKWVWLAGVFALPWIPLLGWYWYKLPALPQQTKVIRNFRSIIASAGVFIILPMLVMQHYLELCQQKPEVTTTISSIPRFYSGHAYVLTQHCYIDSAHIGVAQREFMKYNKLHDSTRVICFYYAIPVFDNIADTIGCTPTAWFQVAYAKKIPLTLHGLAFKKIWDELDRTSKQDLASGTPFRFQYLSTGRASTLPFYKAAMLTNGAYAGNEEKVLIPQTQAFGYHNNDFLVYFWIAMFLCALLFWILMDATDLSIPQKANRRKRRVDPYYR